MVPIAMSRAFLERVVRVDVDLGLVTRLAGMRAGAVVCSLIRVVFSGTFAVFLVDGPGELTVGRDFASCS
jgi:hypothetical protein